MSDQFTGLLSCQLQLGVLGTETLTQIHQEVDLLLLEPVVSERKRLRGRGRSGLTVRHLKRDNDNDNDNNNS